MPSRTEMSLVQIPFKSQPHLNYLIFMAIVAGAPIFPGTLLFSGVVDVFAAPRRWRIGAGAHIKKI